MSVVGCVSPAIKNDIQNAAIDSRYHSAEIVVNGDHNLGIAAAKADPGRPFSFSVAGIHRGTITIRSKECGVDISQSYSGSALYPFTVDVKDRCLFAISVFPDFTEKESNGIEWRGLTGVLAVRLTSNVAVVKAERLRFMNNALLDLELNERSRVYLRGCGFKHHLVHNPGLFSVEIKDNLNPEGGDCVVDGYAAGVSGRKLDLAILLSHYAIDFTRLPLPELKIGERSLTVSADSSVSFMSFGKENVFSNSHTFQGSEGVLRLYTNKGRYAFCVIDRVAQCYH